MDIDNPNNIIFYLSEVIWTRADFQKTLSIVIRKVGRDDAIIPGKPLVVLLLIPEQSKTG